MLTNHNGEKYAIFLNCFVKYALLLLLKKYASTVSDILMETKVFFSLYAFITFLIFFASCFVDF